MLYYYYMSTLYIFSDGNCKNNGKKNSKGRYSVYFGKLLPFSNFNTTIIIENNKPTNNQMELFGILYIYKILYEHYQIFKDINIIIVSDSQYSINCINGIWSDKWIKNGWVNSKKESVKNKELIQKILEFKNKINCNLNIKFKHVFSHLQEPNDKNSLEWICWNGNEIVDMNINKKLNNYNNFINI